MINLAHPNVVTVAGEHMVRPTGIAHRCRHGLIRYCACWPTTAACSTDVGGPLPFLANPGRSAWLLVGLGNEPDIFTNRRILNTT